MATLGTELAQSLDRPTQPSLDAALTKRSAPASTSSFSRRQWLFVFTDFCCIIGGAILGIFLRFHSASAHTAANLTLEGHLGISVLYAVLIVLFSNTHGLYSVYQPIPRFQELIAVLKSILLATILLAGTLFVAGIKSTSRFVIATTAIYALLSMVGWRTFRRWSLGKAMANGLTCHNVLIVGTDPTALALAHHLSSHRQLGFVVLGHLSTEPESGSAALHPSPAAFPSLAVVPSILGAPTDLKTICRAHFADEVIICTNHRPTVLQAITDARECGLGVRVIPDLYDGLARCAQLQYLGDFPSMTVVHRSIPVISMALKRALDLLLSGLALIFLSPLFALLAMIVKFDSPGPMLFASRRVGKKGRHFFCYKFRTMVADAERQKFKLQHLNERNGVIFKITNDPRITRAGRIMRKYSLDELPQFWNVFIGDMSLVGPRPPLLNEVKQYQHEYLKRLEAAPGITGLWQVEARNHPSFGRYIALDLYYIENWTFGLDIQILCRTIAVVLAGTGS